MLMNTNKRLYEAPTTDVLELRFEGALLTLSGGGSITNATEEDYGEF